MKIKIYILAWRADSGDDGIEIHYREENLFKSLLDWIYPLDEDGNASPDRESITALFNDPDSTDRAYIALSEEGSDRGHSWAIKQEIVDTQLAGAPNLIEVVDDLLFRFDHMAEGSPEDAEALNAARDALNRAKVYNF